MQIHVLGRFRANYEQIQTNDEQMRANGKPKPNDGTKFDKLQFINVN